MVNQLEPKETPVDKLIQQSASRTKIILSFSSLALVIFLVLATLGPFRDQILNSLYPKQKSEAGTVQPPTPTPTPKGRQRPYTLAALEVSDSTQIKAEEIAKQFYSNHEDNYDFLAIFNNLGSRETSYTMVQNNVKGIGKEVFNNSTQYGSKGRLLGIGMMGDINSYYSEEDEDFKAYRILLSDLIARQWGIYVGNPQDSGKNLPLLAGETLPDKWSPCLSFPSLVIDESYWQASSWIDNGDGTFTKESSGNKTIRFDPFLLYLMGELPTEKVSEAVLISPDGNNKASTCAQGATVKGTAQVITIKDLIAVYGSREPAADKTNKEVSVAYVLLVAKDSQPPPLAMQKLLTWATGLPAVLQSATILPPTAQAKKTQATKPLSRCYLSCTNSSQCGSSLICGNPVNDETATSSASVKCLNSQCPLDDSCQCKTLTPTPASKKD